MDISNLTRAQRATAQGLWLFDGCPPDTAQRVLSDPRCLFRSYPSGREVCGESDAPRALGLILDGRVSVEAPAPGGDYRMGVFGAGDCFGAAAMFAQSAHYVTRLYARAATDLILFEQPLLEDLMRATPQAAFNYIAFLSQRVRILNRKIEALACPSAEAAVAGYLHRSAGGADRVTPDVSLSELARRLNIGRASLYRALDALEADGVIRRDGRTVAILDPPALFSRTQ